MQRGMLTDMGERVDSFAICHFGLQARLDPGVQATFWDLALLSTLALPFFIKSTLRLAVSMVYQAGHQQLWDHSSPAQV